MVKPPCSHRPFNDIAGGHRYRWVFYPFGVGTSLTLRLSFTHTAQILPFELYHLKLSPISDFPMHPHIVKKIKLCRLTKTVMLTVHSKQALTAKRVKGGQ